MTDTELMALLDEIKDYLDITWDLSEPEKKKLISMMNRGIAALEGKIGSCNFVKETQEKTLLFNHVMYERSGALDEFWRNYQREVISLQIDRWMKNAEIEE